MTGRFTVYEADRMTDQQLWRALRRELLELDPDSLQVRTHQQRRVSWRKCNECAAELQRRGVQLRMV